MKVYLAGPINGCTDEQCKGWREKAKAGLVCETFDPMKRDYRGQEGFAFREIVEMDKQDIDGVDVLLVMYERPSVGTSMEILYAWERGKEVVLVTPTPVSLSPWLVYHCRKFYHTLDAAISYLNFRAGQ